MALKNDVGAIQPTFDFVFFCPESVSATKRSQVIARIGFYFSHFNFQVVSDLSNIPLSTTLIVVTNEAAVAIKNTVMQARVFNVDPEDTQFEAWVWHDLKIACSKKTDEIQPIKKLAKRISSLKKNDLSKTCLFGTGPTLASYAQYDFTDGYTIVSNTTVRDKQLWDQLKPDFVVAGDAVFHFGPSEYAAAFMRDLQLRLLENPDTFFVYPEIFDLFVSERLANHRNQLLPLPVSSTSEEIHLKLSSKFELPHLGNSLTLLMLPIAALLTKQISLFGFDGKAPGDKLFWNHSLQHNYYEYMSGLKKLHPAFFKAHLPKNDTDKYQRENMGDALENILTDLEKNGYKLTMMHRSYTPALHARYDERR